MEDHRRTRKQTSVATRLTMYALAIPLSLAVFAATGCNEPASPRGAVSRKAVATEPCAAEPLAPFDCAQDGGSAAGSVHFSGVVSATEAADEFGRQHFSVREASGLVHRLVFQAAGQPLPVEESQAYDFELDRVGGMPPVSGLIVKDGHGLVFAGASDQGIGAHVLGAGVSGFRLELLPSTCASRAQGDCFEAVFNRALQVSSAGESVKLYQGESARLSGYEVRCLIAQQVQYSARCADFALHAVSYTIARVK